MTLQKFKHTHVVMTQTVQSRLSKPLPGNKTRALLLTIFTHNATTAYHTNVTTRVEYNTSLLYTPAQAATQVLPYIVCW